MDCHDSKLNGAVFGIHDWQTYLRDQAARYRKLVGRADDPFIKTELLALASVCDEIADNIEDHLTGGEDHAPRGPVVKAMMKEAASTGGLTFVLPQHLTGRIMNEVGLRAGQTYHGRVPVFLILRHVR